MLKKILIAFASLLGLVLVVGLVLPTTYRVERSLLILAPSEAVYAQVAEPRRWREWTPWNEERYPDAQWMFGGPELGAGSVRTWTGDVVGRGTLFLSEANPITGVAYQAALDDGQYAASGRISFEPVEGGTLVTWVDEGRIGRSPLRRYLGPLIRSRLGGGLEEGLARLKKVVETAPEPTPPVPTDAGSVIPPPVIVAPPVQAPLETPLVEPAPSAQEPGVTPSPGGTPPPLSSGEVAAAPGGAVPPTGGAPVLAPSPESPSPAPPDAPPPAETGAAAPSPASAPVPAPVPGDAGTPR